jgi:S1-C subfamily serine protease
VKYQDYQESRTTLSISRSASRYNRETQGGALVDNKGNVIGIVSAQLSQKAALQITGTLAQNVNYAIKGSYVMSFLESVSDIQESICAPKTAESVYDVVVEELKASSVLVLAK